MAFKLRTSSPVKQTLFPFSDAAKRRKINKQMKEVAKQADIDRKNAKFKEVSKTGLEKLGKESGEEALSIGVINAIAERLGKITDKTKMKPPYKKPVGPRAN